MSENKAQYIIVAETPLQSWLRDASTYAFVVATIGTGVFLDSSAMEWFGALVAFIAILGRSGIAKNIHRCDSITQAHEVLRALERKAASQ